MCMGKLASGLMVGQGANPLDERVYILDAASGLRLLGAFYWPHLLNRVHRLFELENL